MQSVLPDRPYGRRWQRARLAFLKVNPFCAMCRERGRHVQADVVDHIVPHKRDPHLFWDRNNWQPLCKRCHDSEKQRIERGRKDAPRFGPDGRVVWRT